MTKLFPYGVKGPSEIPDVADRILDEFFSITKSLKLRAYLGYGLCLGFVRGDGYIIGDNDLDVIVVTPHGSRTCKLGAVLAHYGFESGAVFPPPVNNIHFHKDGILLDVFFRPNNSFYKSSDAVTYKDRTYPVPSPVEKYLEAVYGDWKTNKKDGQGRGDI